MVSFTLGERAHQYPFHRKLGGPQSQFGHYGEEKNLFPLLRIEAQLSQLSIKICVNTYVNVPNF
jgi:hypothetical protein